ncbi:SRPBCC family protein [Chitinophaga vietnamensis]|uniref:SRPBCC family protein n=1 Tax=Chitinophaga vietnamensis TaxID=2593957 RepID=UPI001178915D|nr:SRPBCC family protein [Chitinophaga vietnamensis]
MKDAIKTPVSSTAMLIRKPVAQVFEAFVDPAVTTRFWFTKSSGRLEKGKPVTWTWEMYNISAEALVTELVPNERIEVNWNNMGNMIHVVWTFEPISKDTTFVSIGTDGFKGDAMEMLQWVNDNTGGFCWVLAGLKALLEFGIELNLVRDRFPQGK